MSMSNSEFRSRLSQTHRTLVHSSLPQPTIGDDHHQVLQPQHTFVIAADTQYGMIQANRRPSTGQDWAEVKYSQAAIQAINQLNPRPLFCCVCGDLVNMTADIYKGKQKADSVWTEQECNEVQDAQNKAFQKVWADLHPDIVLICVCGNHDVGDRPTAGSIQRFQNFFGDDYLAFWANGTYNIVLNTSLISHPHRALDEYEAQWTWLQDRLEYATQSKARNIFVFGHHPWFLYDQNEDETTLPGKLVWPQKVWGPEPPNWIGFPDSYFPIPRIRRRRFLELFERYKVTACFAGHYHQNLVTQTSFGMDMITTGPLSIVLQSNANQNNPEPAALGFRVVRVHAHPDGGRGTMTHEYVSLETME